MICWPKQTELAEVLKLTLVEGKTLTCTMFEVTFPHPGAPMIWTLKNIELVTGQYWYGLVVPPAMFVHVTPLGEDCHCKVPPVNEVRLKVTHPPLHTCNGETLVTPTVGPGCTVTGTVTGGIG